jgi:N-acetyl-anhydromuramyl-L-alanine amidase AmpD
MKRYAALFLVFLSTFFIQKGQAETHLLSDVLGTVAPCEIRDLPIRRGFRPVSRSETTAIVLHSSHSLRGQDPHSVTDLVRVFESFNVSAHYVIDRAGCPYRLVPDDYVSYHAGVSRMPSGRTEVNKFSVGIEIIQTYNETPTEAQYQAVRRLILMLKSRYPNIRDIVGHGQVAPDRRSDPWNFDWARVQDLQTVRLATQ